MRYVGDLSREQRNIKRHSSAPTTDWKQQEAEKNRKKTPGSSQTPTSLTFADLPVGNEQQPTRTEMQPAWEKKGRKRTSCGVSTLFPGLFCFCPPYTHPTHGQLIVTGKMVESRDGVALENNIGDQRPYFGCKTVRGKQTTILPRLRKNEQTAMTWNNIGCHYDKCKTFFFIKTQKLCVVDRVTHQL